MLSTPRLCLLISLWNSVSCVCVGQPVCFSMAWPAAGVVLQVLALQWQKVGQVGSLTNKRGGGDRRTVLDERGRR